MTMVNGSRYSDQNMTMEKVKLDQSFKFDDWTADPADGSLVRGIDGQRLEPKVMTLLCLLAQAAPGLVTREQIMQQLWPHGCVSDDALSRCLLKLRKALDDDARQPRYIETVPKRGYRLLATVHWLPNPSLGDTDTTTHADRRRNMRPVVAAGIAVIALLTIGLTMFAQREQPNSSDISTGPVASVHNATPPGMALLQRAHDQYYQFNRDSNESAATIYQRLLRGEIGSLETESQETLGDALERGAVSDQVLAQANAGLANSLVQRVIRWPPGRPSIADDQQTLRLALNSGRTDSPWAQETLLQARALAMRGVQLDPDEPMNHKALGLVLTALRQFDEAETAYFTALELDAGYWEAWLNLGELNQIRGETALAIDYFKRAYQTMEQRYTAQPQRIALWSPALGVSIGEQHQSMGENADAEDWYRKVLQLTPLNVRATVNLAQLRHAAGDKAEAQALCSNLVLRIGPMKECGPFLPGLP